MALKKWMSGKHWGPRAERKEAQNKARRATDFKEGSMQELEYWDEADRTSEHIEENLKRIEKMISEGWTLRWVPPGQDEDE